MSELAKGLSFRKKSNASTLREAPGVIQEPTPITLTDEHKFLSALVCTLLQTSTKLGSDSIGRIKSQIECAAAQPSIPCLLHAIKKIKPICQSFEASHSKSDAAIVVQATWKSHQARNRLSKLAIKYESLSNCARRNDVFREIVKTERAYIKNLSTITREYLLPVRDLQKKKTFLLTTTDASAIFSNVEMLLETHISLLSKFEELSLSLPDLDSVGDLFNKMAPSFKEYGPYAKNFKFSVDTLLRCQQEEKFASFLDETFARTAENGLDLHALLACPLNRISQYKIHFESLLKLTPHTHLDYLSLVSCYAILSQLYDFIQDSLEQADNMATLSDVYRRIDFGDQKNDIMMFEHRTFIREGPVLIQEQKKANRKKRHLFMFNDVCLVTKQMKPATFRLKSLLPLDEDISVEDEPDTSSTKFAFQILVNDQPLGVMFKNQEEKDSWMKEIETAVEINTKKTRIFGVPLVELLERENLSVPLIIQKITQHILEKGLRIPGILRQNIAASRKKGIKKLFESGMDTLDLSTLEIHEVAAVLKYYLRTLPAPLLTDQNVQMSHWLDAVEKKPLDRLQVVRSLVQQLRAENRRVVRYLCNFLQKICEHSAFNEMNYTNLSIIFGPSLLRPEKETMEYTLQIPKVNQIVQFLLENAHEIFQEEVEQPDNTTIQTTELSESDPIQVMALYAFKRRKDTELEFKKGDVITVIEQTKSGWWKGILDDQVGRFPANYCKIIEEEPEIDNQAPLRAVVMFAFKKRKEGEIDLSKGDTIEVLEKQKSGWWIGKNSNGEVGKFPSNYCRVVACDENL